MKNKKEEVPVIPPREIVVGNADGPVRLEMFGDYESDACKKMNDIIKELLELYPDKIAFTFRHFPMTRIHQKAHKAAEAAIGAAQEGKFWEMHQVLYDHPHSLGVISLKSFAREVGVTDKKFLDHLINSHYGWFVQDDLRDGLDRGVKDIPALFINDTVYSGAVNLKNLKKEIDTVLEEVKPVKKRA